MFKRRDNWCYTMEGAPNEHIDEVVSRKLGLSHETHVYVEVTCRMKALLQWIHASKALLTMLGSCEVRERQLFPDRRH